MKPETLFAIPKKGLDVFNPYTGQNLPEEGEEIPNVSYWHRRAKEGSVELKISKETKKRGENKEAKGGKTKA